MSEPRHFPPGVGKGIFSSSLYNVQRNPSISTRPASAFALAAAAAAVSGLSTVVMMSQCPHALPDLETIFTSWQKSVSAAVFLVLWISLEPTAPDLHGRLLLAHILHNNFLLTLHHPNSRFYSSTNITSIRFLQHHTKVITNCPNRRMAHELKEASMEAQISGSFSNRRGQRSCSLPPSLSRTRARLRYGSLPVFFFGSPEAPGRRWRARRRQTKMRTSKGKEAGKRGEGGWPFNHAPFAKGSKISQGVVSTFSDGFPYLLRWKAQPGKKPSKGSRIEAGMSSGQGLPMPRALSARATASFERRRTILKKLKLKSFIQTSFSLSLSPCLCVCIFSLAQARVHARVAVYSPSLSLSRGQLRSRDSVYQTGIEAHRGNKQCKGFFERKKLSHPLPFSFNSPSPLFPSAPPVHLS